jgi:hypothetical protein
MSIDIAVRIYCALRTRLEKQMVNDVVREFFGHIAQGVPIGSDEATFVKWILVNCVLIRLACGKQTLSFCASPDLCASLNERILG